jgi:aldehyde:ferredoxin oxidoreductase
LTHLGIKALILEDQPENELGWWVLHLNTSGANFVPANDLTGCGVYETAERLTERYGDKSAIALIGPGGEMGLFGAGIQNLDKDGVPSRIAARGGLGAVMGSKRIKAIVIDAAEGAKPAIADLEAFRAAQKDFNQALMAHPQTKSYTDYGTAAMTNLSNTLGAIPTRNFTEGQFEAAESISGDHMRKLLLARGGASDTSHACMAGCTIRCSNIFADEDGEAIVSPLEYETIGLMGSNLGLETLDEIARLNWVVNDLGLDTIEIGASLGIAIAAGLMSFGDSERALELIEEIRSGTSLGKVLGNGPASMGRAFDIDRVPVVKGQAISAYDPRVIKGTGVTYATSPQGADHTCGLTIRAKVDHHDPAIQPELSRNAQFSMAGYDSLGACVFAGFGFAATPPTIRDLLQARYGIEFADNILRELGKETIKLEKEFNRRAGFKPADDRLPKWMTEEPVPPHNTVFDVPEEDLDRIFDELWELA